MHFRELLALLPPDLAPTRIHTPGEGDPLIRGMGYDSRSIAPGDLFFALRGELFDGHAYLPQAVGLGAAALVVQSLPDGLDLRDCAVAEVPDSRRAMAPLAAAFFGRPSDELELVGITGTNGKTSSAYLMESILQRAGRNTGLIGTVEMRYAGERIRAVNTTPESLDLQRTLRDMRTRGVDAVAMEVSSHGLELGRVEGCRFAVAGVTNLTQDHLDFHGNMDRYRESKALLFRRYLAADGVAVVNVDDPSGEAFAAAAVECGARVLRVSRRGEAAADVCVEQADIRLDGSDVRLRVPGGELALRVPLLGDFNLENTAVAVGMALGLGIDAAAIAEGVAGCPQVPGRMERVASQAAEDEPTVLVDYAHTPDAVEKLLLAVRPLCAGRLIALVGCGGDRDRSKRPLMAGAAARGADLVVITSDNPRTEDAEAILDDVEPGLSELSRVEPEALASSERAYARVSDRRQAIELAVAAAGPRDGVVIAGKGHEDYQIVGRERLPFDDRDEARRALRLRAGT